MKTDILKKIIIVRGAGEMASGVIHRLHQSNFAVIALEKSKPVCVRRLVCFANTVYGKNMTIEGVQSVLVKTIDEALNVIGKNIIPLIIDSGCKATDRIKPVALIDCRMLKKDSQSVKNLAPIVIGLGPGFEANVDCHAVIETNRGSDLGKVIYDGKAEEYTGIPAEVNSFTHERVIRAVAEGKFVSIKKITDMVKAGDVLGEINGIKVIIKINGVIRGLIHESVIVRKGQKIGDIDPRGNKDYCIKISDKASAIADGVLKALRKLL